MVGARGGEVLVASSGVRSAWALLRVMRSSGMLRVAVWSTELLMVRLCVVAILRELVVREGMTGAPGAAGPANRGDCGSLLDPVRLRPDSGTGILDGLVERVPVRAANESALAVS